ncbi:MAG: winged helix-turn-helix transcriptional regulator [Lachnospiraceae bacterium]|nr:winged helix-turn-helix transcriptional regulator [Lachnospiraceae bacterium]
MKYNQGEHLEEFNRLYREMDKIYHDLAVKAGMSDSAFFILYGILEMGDGCLQKEIAKRYSISKQTVNSSIQNLKEKGYLSLEEGRGRDKHIYFTKAGQKFVEEKVFPVMEMEKEVFSEMSLEESRELLGLMKKYLEIFQKKVREEMGDGAGKK